MNLKPRHPGPCRFELELQDLPRIFWWDLRLARRLRPKAEQLRSQIFNPLPPDFVVRLL
jgi:hypothetical protein